MLGAEPAPKRLKIEFSDCNCGVNPCILNSTRYFCHCLPGYQEKDDDCIDIDECADPSTCPNALCLNRPGTYSCQCLPGNDGPIYADVDECRYGSHCPDHSVCTNTDGGYYCTCEQGYQGDNCEGEPNGNITKNCVHLWPLANFRWDDMPCGRNNYYICQYDMAQKNSNVSVRTHCP
ncbi:adhesion G protein-coupled receptor E5-like [Branchiostoma floridae x Branchiostoma belcheri]